MAKSQTSPVERAARLLDLVPFISTHQGIELSALAREFDISESELLGDLNTLWMCGLPGYTPLELIDLEFESGYVSIRNAEILQRVRLLTKQELVILILGLDILRDSISDHRSDIRASIKDLSNRIKGIIGNVATAEPIVNSNFRSDITNAISSRRDLDIGYYSMIRDHVSSRKITPLDISVDFGFEVLNAYCNKAQSFRTFRLENLRSVEIVDEASRVPVERIEEFSEWKIAINSRYRTSFERFRLTATDVQSASANLISVQSFSEDWLRRSALSTLGSVEVVSPQEARAVLSQSCRQVLDLYENIDFN